MKFTVELDMVKWPSGELVTDTELVRRHIQEYSFVEEDLVIEVDVEGTNRFNATYRNVKVAAE